MLRQLSISWHRWLDAVCYWVPPSHTPPSPLTEGRGRPWCLNTARSNTASWPRSHIPTRHCCYGIWETCWSSNTLPSLPVRIAGSLHWGSSYTSSGMPTQGPSGPTIMQQYLYITVHTGLAKAIKIWESSRGEFREKQENKRSQDSVHRATQASGCWDPSDYKSGEQQKGRQAVLLILLGLLCTDHFCTCVV